MTQRKYLLGQGQINTRAIIDDVARDFNTQLAKKMRTWADSFVRSASSRADTLRINEETAAEARTAVELAYHNSPIGKRKSYREDDTGKLHRYAGGQMERALADPDFIKVDSNRIFFGNKQRLDYHAKQWYRLNFGALPKSSPKPAVTQIKFQRRNTGKSVNLNDYGPSKPFLVPYGFFSQTFARGSSSTQPFRGAAGRGLDAFYFRQPSTAHAKTANGRLNKPSFINQPILSEGIQGYQFLSAGTTRISQVYGGKIEGMVKEWEKRAKQALKR